MAEDTDLVYEARCSRCGWTSQKLPLKECEAQVDQHMAIVHPLSPEMQQWLKEQGVE